MKLSALMATIPAPDPNFDGGENADDLVLAVDLTTTQDAAIGDFIAVVGSVAGVDTSLNPTETSKAYLHEGISSIKTNTQRSFAITADRDMGSEFQREVTSHRFLFGTGKTCVVNYVWFDACTGKGERGKGSIIVNSDGSGNAGDRAGVTVDLKQTKGIPEEYTYAPATLSPLTVVSIAGSAAGKTKVTATPAKPSNLNAMYKTGASVAVPAFDEVVTAWTAFTSGNDYTGTAGQQFVVAYVDTANKVKYAGKATIVVA